MRILRICLLVLLAVLLPARGAVAAAMLCPPAVASTSTDAMAEHAQHHAEHQTHDHHMQGHGDTAPEPAAHHGSLEKCQLCCDLGSLNPLWSALPSVSAPQDFSALSFPRFSAAAASFIAGGQERPPRST